MYVVGVEREVFAADMRRWAGEVKVFLAVKVAGCKWRGAFASSAGGGSERAAGWSWLTGVAGRHLLLLREDCCSGYGEEKSGVSLPEYQIQ